MTNCHVSLGSKSKLWSPQRTQTAGFSAILIAMWTMKKTIDTRIQIPNNRNTPIPEIIFFHRKIQPFQNIFFKCRKLVPHSHKHEQGLQDFVIRLLVFLSEGKLGRYSTGKELSIHRSLVQSFVSPLKPLNWICRRGYRCNGTKNPNHTSTNPRILSVSLRRLWVLGRPRHDAPLCWDLRDKSFEFL